MADEAEHAAAVVENVVDQATSDANRRAAEAEQAARAIAESAIITEQGNRFNAFRSEMDQWRTQTAAEYRQSLQEATAPLNESLSKLMERLQSAPAAPPPEPPKPQAVEPSTQPPLVDPTQVPPEAAAGSAGSPAAPPSPSPRGRVRLL